ncbi:MAG: hypothetical protein ACP5OG_03045 [Candidatus Nanoarchaeia archaeon]
MSTMTLTKTSAVNANANVKNETKINRKKEMHQGVNNMILAEQQRRIAKNLAPMKAEQIHQMEKVYSWNLVKDFLNEAFELAFKSDPRHQFWALRMAENYASEFGHSMKHVSSFVRDIEWLTKTIKMAIKESDQCADSLAYQLAESARIGTPNLKIICKDLEKKVSDRLPEIFNFYAESCLKGAEWFLLNCKKAKADMEVSADRACNQLHQAVKANPNYQRIEVVAWKICKEYMSSLEFACMDKERIQRVKEKIEKNLYDLLSVTKKEAVKDFFDSKLHNGLIPGDALCISLPKTKTQSC